MSWKVNYFKTPRGASPVSEFIENLDIDIQAKVIHSIDMLADYGPFLKPPYAKKLHAKLYELRVSGKTSLRIFYTIFDNGYYILHIFKKKSKKTPTKELEIAIDRMKKII